MLSKIVFFFILYIFVKNILKLLTTSKTNTININKTNTQKNSFNKKDVIEADFKVID